MHNVSLLDSKMVKLPILALCLNLMSKPASFYFISAVIVVHYFSTLLQSYYQQPRPFWISSEIKSEFCLLDYGNPSGQLIVNTFVSTTVYFNAYYDIGVKRKKMSVFCTEYIVKMALTSVGLIAIILLMTSLVYQGIHSWNQVLFGAVIGVGLGVIGHYNVKSWFYGLWERSLDNNHSRLNRLELFRIVLFIVPFIIFDTVLFVVRVDQTPSFLQNPSDLIAWQMRMKDAGCSDLQIKGFPRSDSMKDLWSLRYLLLPLVAMLGQFAEWHFIVNSNRLNSSVWTFQQTSLVTTIMRYTAISILGFIILSP